MMLPLLTLVLVVSFFEIRGMVKNRQTKEIVVFAVMAVLTLGLGLFYTGNPYRESLAQQLLRLIDRQF